MTDILIFDTYDRKGCKDIVFYTAYTGMVLPLVHFSAYCALMPSFSYLFTVCH
jgi:hypothetical protein